MPPVLAKFTLSLLALASPFAALSQDWTLDAYTGLQVARESTVSGRDELGTPFEFSAGWEGRSLDLPPYWGLRAMRERDVDSDWSFGLEFTHAKIHADDQTLASSGFGGLEFSDGLNILTANAQRQVDISDRWSAHAGLGLGVSVPYVEVTTPGGAETSGYQFGGPVARWYLGARYDLSDRWSAFAEYSGTYSMNSVDLDGGGGLETDIVTSALNLGLGLSF